MASKLLATVADLEKDRVRRQRPGGGAERLAARAVRHRTPCGSSAANSPWCWKATASRWSSWNSRGQSATILKSTPSTPTGRPAGARSARPASGRPGRGSAVSTSTAVIEPGRRSRERAGRAPGEVASEPGPPGPAPAPSAGRPRRPGCGDRPVSGGGGWAVRAGEGGDGEEDALGMVLAGHRRAQYLVVVPNRCAMVGKKCRREPRSASRLAAASARRGAVRRARPGFNWVQNGFSQASNAGRGCRRGAPGPAAQRGAALDQRVQPHQPLAWRRRSAPAQAIGRRGHPLDLQSVDQRLHAPRRRRQGPGALARNALHPLQRGRDWRAISHAPPPGRRRREMSYWSTICSG